MLKYADYDLQDYVYLAEESFPIKIDPVKTTKSEKVRAHVEQKLAKQKEEVRKQLHRRARVSAGAGGAHVLTRKHAAARFPRVAHSRLLRD